MHSELIFYKVWGMGGVSLYSQHHVLKRQACISESPLYLCQKSIGHMCLWLYFWTLYSVPLIFVFLFFFFPQYLTDCIAVALQEVLKSGCVQSPAFFFSITFCS